MILLQIFIEFFKIGLFSIGGGLATLPFLFNLIDKYPWYTTAELINMIAVSESTPGPIGVNIATYVGMINAGIPGSIVASLSVSLPSLIISVILASQFLKVKDSKFIKDIFYGIRPVVAGLIGSAAFSVIKTSLINIEGFTLSQNIIDLFNILPVVAFIALFIASKKLKVSPILLIVIAAIIGIIFKF